MVGQDCCGDDVVCGDFLVCGQYCVVGYGYDCVDLQGCVGECGKSQCEVVQFLVCI